MNKNFYTLAFISILVVSAFTYSYTSSSTSFSLGDIPDPGHHGDEITVKIGTTYKTLQRAIQDGDLISYWNPYSTNIYYLNTVGIGTSTPSTSFKLDVNGNIRAGTIYDKDSTAYYLNPNSISKLNQIRTYTLCDENGANCKDLSAGWDSGTASVWSTGTSTIYSSSTATKIGIGTSSPSYLLDVNGEMQVEKIYDTITSYYLDPSSTSRVNRINTYYLCDENNDNCKDLSAGWDSGTTSPWTSGTSTIYYLNTVGIGTSSPSTTYKLDVNGNIRSGIIYDKDSTSYYLDPNSISSLQDIKLKGKPNCEVLKTDSDGDIICTIFPSTTTSPWSTGTSTIYSSSTATKIGIGTSTPSYLLDVNGEMQANKIYDSDINYYLDPASTSRVNRINTYYLCDENGANCKDVSTGWDSGTTSPWIISGSNIYYSTGNVGIKGLASTSYALDVNGEMQVQKIYDTTTTYYLDPASTSRVNKINTYYLCDENGANCKDLSTGWDSGITDEVGSTTNGYWCKGTGSQVSCTESSIPWSAISGEPTIGDITGVTAGNGLTGTATSGTATLNVGAGTGITVSADSISATLGTSITENEIAQNILDDSEIQDNSLTAISLAADSVGASEIATNAVGAAEIATGAVGSSEIADNSITGSDLKCTGQTVLAGDNNCYTASEIVSAAGGGTTQTLDCTYKEAVAASTTTVYCDAGYTRTGGGFSMSISSGTKYSKPYGTNGWQCYSGGQTVTCYVTCCRLV
ncbi:hypothetical protein C0585_08245 [Candidatus Woesearchaeota archaeon]|nr:MAG: hypothetical protein C0585_08245 [Candidatus Woesearchaeota archaeon]